MRVLPRDGYRQTVVLLFLSLFVLTCIKPPYWEDFLLQHVLTLTALAVLVFADRRLKLSKLSFTAAFLFLGFHLVGARYLYSNVPYDDWVKMLTGATLSEQFGWERNHYDRLVHFSYGLLLSIPVREILHQRLRVPVFWATLLAIDVILSTSAIYELMEWGVAMTLDPESAEAYNGQQGDIWDAHKDMLLAFLGATLSMSSMMIYNRKRVCDQPEQPL